ncbi:SAICAR synthase-like protein [Aspergillus costaricaensis CBS 115574]|uniref:SAICAR synthase-like protein n=1 Tax=Aspergillus costaricaensis CBS 115574 TaxID=1448317 RepID=A0ACD1ITT6_9EURO|nr:SAICAR synthase-like protein [Aspergillus costaricaensis CBS 115574]RAK93165.1 SAICAR synthase-like protein [Aspergillus costaricaensis CBS 115574]
MGSSRRQKALSKSIQLALFRDPATFRKTLIGRILAFFSIFYIKLFRYGSNLFRKLRSETWEIDENEYKASFRDEKKTVPLKPMGDLGMSGSTFFQTSNGKFLIKSLPRHFEHSFFREDLLEPYYEYMSAHRDSLLVWITDYVYAPYQTVGSLIGSTPAHHIIMDNILYGKTEDPKADQWEKYDLKPIDYFYPERDLVPEPLVSEDTLRKLADQFDDKIRLSQEQYESLKQVLEADTDFLRSSNAVDYSLFLVRFPASSQPEVIGRHAPWRIGVESADGKWKYRAVLLDFFWARHKLHAQAMTGVIQTFNVIGRQGPMTITTTADEYQQKFLAMVDSMVEVQQS